MLSASDVATLEKKPEHGSRQAAGNRVLERGPSGVHSSRHVLDETKIAGHDAEALDSEAVVCEEVDRTLCIGVTG